MLFIFEQHLIYNFIADIKKQFGTSYCYYTRTIWLGLTDTWTYWDGLKQSDVYLFFNQPYTLILIKCHSYIR